MFRSPINCGTLLLQLTYKSSAKSSQRALLRSKLSTDFQTFLSQNKCLSSLYFSMNSGLHIHRTRADSSRCSAEKGKQESPATYSEPGKVTLLLTGCAAHLLDLPRPAPAPRFSASFPSLGEAAFPHANTPWSTQSYRSQSDAPRDTRMAKS